MPEEPPDGREHLPLIALRSGYAVLIALHDGRTDMQRFKRAAISRGECPRPMCLTKGAEIEGHSSSAQSKTMDTSSFDAAVELYALTVMSTVAVGPSLDGSTAIT